MKTLADFGIVVPAGAGVEFDTTCPQCSAQRKNRRARCLSVNQDKGVWSCHHCGWSGGIGTGEKRFEAPWQKPVYRKPQPVATISDDGVAEWLRERGITPAVAERNRVTGARVYMPQVEEHVKAVAFPYFRDGELVNVKYRDRAKNFRMETGAERILYGLDDIDPACCVIVEGEVDKLSMEVAGIRSCVSVPDGAPTPTAKDYSSKFSFLDDPRLDAVREWIIATDADEPGQRLQDELARRLGREKCKRVRWPSECKDANDALRSYGPEVLAECIANAEPFPIEGVFTVADISDRIDRLYESGWEKGVSTGWAEVDQFYTVRPGEFTVVTGVPNSGKSNWLDAMLVNLAGEHGWRFMLFSPENQPIEDHAARVMEKYAREPFDDGPTPRMGRETKERAKRWVDEHFTWVLPEDESEWTITTILESARQLVRRKGITGLVIDPWNELEHAVPHGMTETVYIGQQLKRIRQFARRHSVHVWIVAHPSMMRRENGVYPVPTLYDISGSANWRNKADNGIVVWRDMTEQGRQQPVEIHVQKIRFRQIGRIGLAKLSFDKVTQTYSELQFMDPRNQLPSRGRKPNAA